jgi:hypothetical protein
MHNLQRHTTRANSPAAFDALVTGRPQKLADALAKKPPSAASAAPVT